MNYHVFQVINGWAGRHDALDDVMEFTATWLIYLVFVVAGLICVQALFERRLRSLALVAFTLIGAFAVATVMAHMSTEVRPFQTHHVVQLLAHENGVSMPSDHATAAFAVATAIGVFLHRGWGVVLAVAAVAIGFARVWSGLHYPGDIFAAALIAVVMTALVWWGDRLARLSSAFTAP